MMAVECPDTLELARLAAGELPKERSSALLEHAESCAACADTLRAAVGNISAELTAEEEELAERLLSRHSPVKPLAREHGTRLWFLLAACLALGVGLATWSVWNKKATPETLLARSYTATRPFEVRLPDAGYTPVRAERGGGSMSIPVVIAAEAAVAGDGSLAQKGWLALLKYEPEQGVAALTEAALKSPRDPDTAELLGAAYAIRGDWRGRQGEFTGQKRDYESSVASLTVVLRQRPDDLEALFNRGLVYHRLGRRDDAKLDLARYLSLDPSTGWATEVRTRLAALRSAE